MGQSTSKSIVNGLRHCTLWKTNRSPACRAVMMALDAMNLSITEVDVNMDKGEHRTIELTVYNPLQTLPIFKDRELVLCDSHAILTYLASRYCPNGNLMPKDPVARARQNQLMHYDSGVLYPRYRAAAHPIIYENCKCVMPQQLCEIECAYRDLECMLMGSTWLGGCSYPTLADINIVATLSTLSVLVPIDKLRYPRLSSWLLRMSKEMYYITGNEKGLTEFSRKINELTEVNKLKY